MKKPKKQNQLKLDESPEYHMSPGYFKIIIFFIGLMVASISAVAQFEVPTLDWAKHYGGSSEDRLWDTAVDSLGNIYTVGDFKATVSVSALDGTTSLTSSGYNDIFLQKFNNSGDLLWAQSYGRWEADFGTTVEIGPDGFVYVAGLFSKTVDFDNSANYNALYGTDNGSAFVLKLNQDGEFVWAKSFGDIPSGSGSARTNDIAISEDHLYLTGYFTGDITFDSTISAVTSDYIDAFLVALDLEGNFQWVNVFDGPGGQIPTDVEVDSEGNILLLGHFNGVTDFDPGTSSAELTPQNSYDMFLLKLDASDEFVWVKAVNSDGVVHGLSMETDSLDNILICGRYDGTVDFDPGNGTEISFAEDDGGYILKLSSLGEFDWVTEIPVPRSSILRSIVVDETGDAFFGGSFSDTIHWASGYGDFGLIAQGLEEALVGKIDQTGSISWLRSFDGPVGGVNGLAVNGDGHLYYGVTFRDSIDGDPSANLVQYQCNGFNDFFVGKLSFCDVPVYEVQDTACGESRSPSGESYWATSGLYFDLISSENGCDSAISIDLVVYEPLLAERQIDTCGLYVSQTGQVWTTSGVYVESIPNLSGCDSIITTILEITPELFYEQVHACDQYTSPSGLILTNSGTYVDTVSVPGECNSVITTFLDITTTQYFQLDETTCGVYESPSGSYQWDQSGVYLDTVFDTNGCATVFTIDLIVDSLTIEISYNLTNATLFANSSAGWLADYTWLDCDDNYSIIQGETFQTFTPDSNGSYAVEVSVDGWCIDTSACVDVYNVGVIETVEFPPMVVASDLANGSVVIYTENKDNYTFTLRNNLGQPLMSESYYGNYHRIDLWPFSAGLYYLEVFGNAENGKVFKVVRN